MAALSAYGARSDSSTFPQIPTKVRLVGSVLNAPIGIPGYTFLKYECTPTVCGGMEFTVHKTTEHGWYNLRAQQSKPWLGVDDESGYVGLVSTVVSAKTFSFKFGSNNPAEGPGAKGDLATIYYQTIFQDGAMPINHTGQGNTLRRGNFGTLGNVVVEILEWVPDCPASAPFPYGNKAGGAFCCNNRAGAQAGNCGSGKPVCCGHPPCQGVIPCDKMPKCPRSTPYMYGNQHTGWFCCDNLAGAQRGECQTGRRACCARPQCQNREPCDKLPKCKDGLYLVGSDSKGWRCCSMPNCKPYIGYNCCLRPPCHGVYKCL